MSSAFTAANAASAHRQASQLLSAVSHPVRSARAVAAATEQARRNADLPQTVASASGDMVGSAAAVTATAMAVTAAAMAVTAAVAPAYMRTGLAQNIARPVSESAARARLSPMLSLRLGRFAATRVIAVPIAAASAAMAAFGSASGREATAAENAQQHPEVSGALAAAHLDVLFATPTSRIVRSASSASSGPPPASALSPMQAPPFQRTASLSATQPRAAAHAPSATPEPPDFF